MSVTLWRLASGRTAGAGPRARTRPGCRGKGQGRVGCLACHTHWRPGHVATAPARNEAVNRQAEEVAVLSLSSLPVISGLFCLRSAVDNKTTDTRPPASP